MLMMLRFHCRQARLGLLCSAYLRDRSAIYWPSCAQFSTICSRALSARMIFYARTSVAQIKTPLPLPLLPPS